MFFLGLREILQNTQSISFFVEISWTVSCSNQYVKTQSRQSARLFLPSSELGLPHPLAPRRVFTPSLVRGEEGYTGEGVGGGTNSGEGTDTWYSRYICTLCFKPWTPSTRLFLDVLFKIFFSLTQDA